MADEQGAEGGQTTDTTQGSQGEGSGQAGAAQGGDGEVKFSQAQLQQLGSMMGRLIDKQLQEKVVPLVQTRNLKAVPKNGDADALAVLNEQLQDDILSGRVTDALDKYMKINEAVRQTVSTQTQQKLQKAITDLSEKPYYEDIYADIQKKAEELVGKQYPPDAAAETAYYYALSKRAEKSSNEGEGSLSMASGGKPKPKKTATTLPDKFEAAFQRDKADGLFKTREEFISNLSPKVRETYGL